MLEVIIWQFLSEITIILNRHLFFQMEKNFYQDNIGHFLGSLDWSAIIAAIAVVISVIALGLQRRDLKKQAKYQRDTFELQNIIDNNKTIIKLISEIESTSNDQIIRLNALPEIIFKKNYYFNKYLSSNGSGDSKFRAYKIFEEKRSELTSSYSKAQATLSGKIKLVILSTQQSYYSDELHKTLENLAIFFSERYLELDKFDKLDLSISDSELEEQTKTWREIISNIGVGLLDNILKETINIQKQVEVEKGKLL